METAHDILVTGGQGLVGSEMTFGRRIGREIVDLTDRNKTIEFFCDVKPRWVIHCAGLVGGVKANMDRKADFFNQNLLMALNVLEASQKAKVPNLVTLMSTCIFPEKHALTEPLNEDMIHDGIPHDSNYGYAYAKRMIDVGVNVYRDQYHVPNWFSLIPTNLYGPNDNYNLETSHLIPALIRKAHLAKTNNTEFVVWGSGKPIREFIYVNDLARLVYQMIMSNFRTSYDKIIVAPKYHYSIGEVAVYIAKKFGIEKIVYDETYPDGQYKKITDTTRFNEVFPDFEFTTLDKGLDITIDYYLSNQNKIRL
jgi:GDP-L-fucose synthase